MAKEFAPFEISGTPDDLNFMKTTEENFAFMPRDNVLNSEKIMSNSIYVIFRNQGKEIGYCAKIHQSYTA